MSLLGRRLLIYHRYLLSVARSIQTHTHKTHKEYDSKWILCVHLTMPCARLIHLFPGCEIFLQGFVVSTESHLSQLCVFCCILWVYVWDLIFLGIVTTIVNNMPFSFLRADRFAEFKRQPWSPPTRNDMTYIHSQILEFCFHRRSFLWWQILFNMWQKSVSSRVAPGMKNACSDSR